MSSLMIKEKSEESDVIVKMLQTLKDQLEAEVEEEEEDLKRPKEPLKQRKTKHPFNNHKKLEK